MTRQKPQGFFLLLFRRTHILAVSRFAGIQGFALKGEDDETKIGEILSDIFLLCTACILTGSRCAGTGEDDETKTAGFFLF